MRERVLSTVTRRLASFALTFAAVASSATLRAETYYWVGETSGNDGTSWETISNWNTVSDSSGSTPTVKLGSGDIARFSSSASFTLAADLTVDCGICIDDGAELSIARG